MLPLPQYLCVRKQFPTCPYWTTEDRQVRFERGTHSDAFLISTYEKLVYPRIIEEKMLSLLRQGKISKWFSGIGQEAISVGAAMVLHEEEYILPMHRNLGVFTTRNMPFSKLFAQWQGKATGYSKGRERSFHFGSQEHKVVGMYSATWARRWASPTASRWPTS